MKAAISHIQVTKLRGKAVSHWTYVRIFPIILSILMKFKDDSEVTLGLKLVNIVERLTAQEFFPYEIILLDEKILE